MDNVYFELIDLVKEKESVDYFNDIRLGFNAANKYIPTKYAYDKAGSLLFDKLTQQPDYYLTHAETEILETYADEIIPQDKHNTVLIELGSGNSKKTRLLLQTLLHKQSEPTFIPIDISKEFLSNSVQALKKDYPTLKIIGVIADYHDGLEALAEYINQPKLIIWLGSDIGHLPYTQASHMLKEKITSLMTPRDQLLLGIDMKKDASIINNGYGCCGNNSSHTASEALARNFLHRINRQLQADFKVEQFVYHCAYNEETGRMDLNLRSLYKQTAFIQALSMQVNFDKDELIHIHHGYKYDNADIQCLANNAGLQWDKQWTDKKNLYTLNLFSRKS